MHKPCIDVDYHVHSGISPDAKGVPMEEMCKSAIRKGLKQIVFTDHFEYYTSDYKGYPFNEEYIMAYFDQIDDCRKKFGSRITILSGMEFGQIHLQPAAMKKYSLQFPFDYIIGSLHKIDNIDLMYQDYLNSDLNEITNNYLDNLYQMVCVGEYDCVGHIDLIKRYAAKQGIKIRLENHADQLDRILKKIIELGKGIEINTSGLRQEVNEALPSFKILKRYRELGGTIITIGSDAHKPEDIGANFAQAWATALNAGFRSISEFKEHKVAFLKIS